MLVSTKGRYALRVLVELAERSCDGYVAMKDIAERQDISLKYLEKILPALVQNGLIEGVHGKGGGYRLTKKPEEYSVGEIIRITEGSLATVKCLDCDSEECSRESDCRTKSLWEELNTIINDFLDGKTLADLME